MLIRKVNQMNRSIPSPAVQSSQSGLPGLIRKKNPGIGGARGTPGSITPSILRRPGISEGTLKGLSLSGTIRKSEPATLADSTPIATEGASVSDISTVPASYEPGEILSKITSVLPTILIVVAVIIGITVISKAGKKGK